MTLWAGLGGASRNACVALCSADRIIGICEQERITRVRAAGFNSTGLPDEALDELLTRSGRKRSDLDGYVLAEVSPQRDATIVSIDHHFAHACSAFLGSPFESATIVVCDHESPHISLWDGHGSAIARIEWPWCGPGFVEIYSQCAQTLGFGGNGHEQRMEALARFDPDRRDARAGQLFAFDTDRLLVPEDWRRRIESWLGVEPAPHQASAIASALQSQLGDLLVEFLADVARQAPARRQLCVAGSLYYNSYFNSRVKLAGIFDEVFVPINPGNAGLAVGGGLHAVGNVRHSVSPFLGPSYTPEEVKATLDNCKLTYTLASEDDLFGIAVENLQQGRLIAWFEGPMEWGPRALGGRSIVANPFAPYVLENLNHFLKQRQPWRGYALSALDTCVDDHFSGPEHSPFMECDYTPRDRERFRHILPGSNASVRIHKVGLRGPERFRKLLHAFGEVSGIPILVNTSFNGFREPIVCSPRDAVRVFFGTGADILVLEQFVISKE